LSIRFKREGQEYIVDTPDEAARLAELFHHEDERRAKIEPAFAKKLALNKSGWTEERFWSVINGIGKEQTRFLVAIFYQQILDAEDLVYGLGLGSQVSLAGVG
jgi:hypothetical protein